jgi:hypothetical protein
VHTAQNLEAVTQVQKLVAIDHQMSLKLIEDKLHINWEMIYHILHRDLDKRKDTHEVHSTVSWTRKGAQQHNLFRFHLNPSGYPHFIR